MMGLVRSAETPGRVASSTLSRCPTNMASVVIFILHWAKMRYNAEMLQVTDTCNTFGHILPPVSDSTLNSTPCAQKIYSLTQFSLTAQNMKQAIYSCTSAKTTWKLFKKTPLLASAATVLAMINPHSGYAQTYQEPYRPQYHFTPAKNWMNDPNGLLDYQGEHHLFYQYNPFGTTWAPTISWGHAISTDWVHWRELPVAIPATDTVSIFSGSAVADRKNTAALAHQTIRLWSPSTA